nr:hypothetical protein [Ferrimicrobium acidiphilum]
MPSWPSMTSALSTGYTFGQVTQYQLNQLIESTFSIVRHRTIKVQGAFSSETAMGMLYQLGLEAERSWRRITGHERIAEVISGVVFVD